MSSRRRAIHYTVLSLHDGTVLGAFPVRKPSPRVLKRTHRKIDADCVCEEFSSAGGHLRNPDALGVTRMQDILANRLNARRTIRNLVLPRLELLEAAVTRLGAQLDRIEARLQQ